MGKNKNKGREGQDGAVLYPYDGPLEVNLDIDEYIESRRQEFYEEWFRYLRETDSDY